MIKIDRNVWAVEQYKHKRHQYKNHFSEELKMDISKKLTIHYPTRHLSFSLLYICGKVKITFNNNLI